MAATWLRGASAVLALCVLGTPAQASPGPAAEAQRIEQGRRIYQEGRLPSGEALTATMVGGVEVSGAPATCAQCHRRSGMGSSEGEEVVAAVTGPLLFAPLRLPTSRPPASPEQRPAYTDETLGRAIRDGIGAKGAPLQPFMPRYRLGDEALKALIAYLHTLSAEHSPGVDGRDIQFATILASTASEAARRAHLDVMRAFFTQKNAETRYETKRATKTPWHKEARYGSYRKWRLHVWELQGPAETWPEQLERYYAEAPVFAVIGGVAGDGWQGVHGFCEAHDLPCLFPTTDLPGASAVDHYSLYLSRGLSLEGALATRYLTGQDPRPKAIVEVYHAGDARGRAAAEGLKAYAKGVGIPVESLAVTRGALAEALRRAIGQGGPDRALVLWLSSADLKGLWDELGRDQAPARIVLSSTLYGTALAEIPDSLRDRTALIHPYELPGRMNRLLLRSSVWLKSRRIYAPEERRVQANAYFALKVVGDALSHMRGYFYRDHLIERIEHMLDNAPFTSVYPRVTLAPGQRYASTGGYITRVTKGTPARLEPISDWLVP